MHVASSESTKNHLCGDIFKIRFRFISKGMAQGTAELRSMACIPRAVVSEPEIA